MIIIDYFLMLIPGLILAGIIFLGVRKAHYLIHLFIFIILFIFTRDAMTPLGLWRIGSEGFLWIRFIADPITLLILSFSSLGLVIVMQAISPKLASLVTWFVGKKITGIVVGILGAILVALPMLLIYRFGVSIENRGGLVPLSLVPFIFLITLSGNLYEEILFRGYFYGWLTEKESIQPVFAGLLSGVFFSFGHVFLAYNVTDVGFSVLIFTLWEGCLAGLVRSKFGLVPAVLTHGLAVFFLTIGLF